MRLIKNVTVIDPSNNIQHVTIEEWKRPNSCAHVWIIQYKDRRIAPYEQRLRGWKFGLNALFKMVYEEHIAALIAEENPFMKFMRKEKSKYYSKMEQKSVTAGAKYRYLYYSATYDQERDNPGSSTFAKMGWLDEDTYELFPERKRDEKNT